MVTDSCTCQKCIDRVYAKISSRSWRRPARTVRPCTQQPKNPRYRSHACCACGRVVRVLNLDLLSIGPVHFSLYFGERGNQKLPIIIIATTNAHNNRLVQIVMAHHNIYIISATTTTTTNHKSKKKKKKKSKEEAEEEDDQRRSGVVMNRWSGWDHFVSGRDSISDCRQEKIA